MEQDKSWWSLSLQSGFDTAQKEKQEGLSGRKNNTCRWRTTNWRTWATNYFHVAESYALDGTVWIIWPSPWLHNEYDTENMEKRHWYMAKSKPTDNIICQSIIPNIAKELLIDKMLYMYIIYNKRTQSFFIFYNPKTVFNNVTSVLHCTVLSKSITSFLIPLQQKPSSSLQLPDTT